MGMSEQPQAGPAGIPAATVVIFRNAPAGGPPQPRALPAPAPTAALPAAEQERQRSISLLRHRAHEAESELQSGQKAGLSEALRASEEQVAAVRAELAEQPHKVEVGLGVPGIPVPWPEIPRPFACEYPTPIRPKTLKSLRMES